MNSSSFGPLRQINAGVLDVGYVETGPANGRPVVLLHGWPYDVHTYADVAPALGAAGYRVIVPYLRGYGTTRFLSGDTMRNGQQSALAVDVIDLMDALGIESAVVAGCDWGARSANIVAALWPERCTAMVSVSGYLIGSQAANSAPLPPPAELSWWYQYHFATERGRIGYDKYRHEFAKLIWHTASPKWNFDDKTFDRTALAFDNADHVDIVIDNYRWRLGLVPGEPQYDDLESNSPPVRPSPCRRSRSKATPTARPTRILAATPRSSPGRTRTARSLAASVTTCPKKRPTTSSKPSSKPTHSHGDGQRPRPRPVRWWRRWETGGSQPPWLDLATSLSTLWRGEA